MALINTGEYYYLSSFKNLTISEQKLISEFKRTIQFATFVSMTNNLIVYDHITNKKYILKSNLYIFNPENNKENINKYFNSLTYNHMFRDDIDDLVNNMESIGKLQDTIRSMVSNTNRNYIFHYGIRKDDYKDESM